MVGVMVHTTHGLAELKETGSGKIKYVNIVRAQDTQRLSVPQLLGKINPPQIKLEYDGITGQIKIFRT